MTTVGTIEVIASIDTSRYKRGADDIQRENANLENSTSRTSSGMNAAFGRVAKVGLGALIAAVATATALIVKNIPAAINRIDSLVAFPRVLSALGVSAEEAQSATDLLAESLRGLPTSLNQGTRGVQAFITSGLDVDRATRAFLGFNNAMLAANVETGAAQASLQQLNQALSRGRLDAQEWNSISANIPTVLQALQNETGKSKEELRELFRENPQGLIDNIIRLNKKGGGGLASLEEQARAATGGIGTAFANMNNAIQRGIQNMVANLGGGDLEAGQRKISELIGAISKAFGDGLVAVGDALGFGVRAIQSLITWLQPLMNYVRENTALFEVLKTTLMVLGGILLGVVLAGIAAVTVAIAGITLVTEVLIKVFELVMQVAIATWGGISSAAVGAWNGIKSAWSGAVGFFSGVVSGIVGVFAAIPRRISGFFSSALSEIKSIFSPSALISAGEALIDGLIDGIVSGFNKAKDIVTGKLEDLRGLFPFSPAKEGPFSGKGYTTYSGRALMDDFAKGMISQSSTITAAARTAVSGASSAFSGLENMNIHAIGSSSAFDNLNGVRGGPGTEVSIGNVYISSEVDGERWLRRLSGNQEIVSNGLVPTQSYM